VGNCANIWLTTSKTGEYDNKGRLPKRLRLNNSHSHFSYNFIFGYVTKVYYPIGVFYFTLRLLFAPASCKAAF